MVRAACFPALATRSTGRLFGPLAQYIVREIKERGSTHLARFRRGPRSSESERLRERRRGKGVEGGDEWDVVEEDDIGMLMDLL